MARVGLVEPGRPGGSAAAESVAEVRARTAEPPPILPPPALLEPIEPVPYADGAELEPLPHRVVSAGNGRAERSAPIGFDDQISEEILLRIRAGLAALR